MASISLLCIPSRGGLSYLGVFGSKYFRKENECSGGVIRASTCLGFIPHSVFFIYHEPSRAVEGTSIRSSFTGITRNFHACGSLSFLSRVVRSLSLPYVGFYDFRIPEVSLGSSRMQASLPLFHFRKVINNREKSLFQGH